MSSSHSTFDASAPRTNAKLWLLALAFFKLLLPLGFMPVATATGVELQLCSGLISGATSSPEQEYPSHAADQLCSFAASANTTGPVVSAGYTICVSDSRWLPIESYEYFSYANPRLSQYSARAPPQLIVS